MQLQTIYYSSIIHTISLKFYFFLKNNPKGITKPEANIFNDEI